MASRIKGITVEIGGDTTGLDRALKGVQSTLRQTTSQLRDVQRLLKLDPANTELLTQKQRLLKDAISQTKEKLSALKDAQAQAKQQLEDGDLGQDKYDALCREIEATEQDLRKLESRAAETDTTLQRMSVAGQAMEDAGDKISGAGAKLMGASAAIGGLGVAAVKTTADFDASMSQVQAISGATGEDFEKLRDKAREMGSKTRFSASDAADGLNYMAAAGWSTQQMLDGIDGVMNLAAAGGEDLASTADIVTGSLTAFGLSAKDSAHFADLLAAAAAYTNAGISDMGETFKYCAPIAGALGFSAKDTAEAVGLMANAGIKSTQAGTALRTIMNSLSGEVKITGKNIGEVTIATSNADGSMRSLSDILADCRKAFSGLSDSEKANAASSLVGKNAMSGFLALMNASPDEVDKLSQSLDDCDGAADKMAKTMEDNLPGQMEELKSALEDLAISFGDLLMPVVRSAVSKVQGFVEKLDSMDDGAKRAVLAVALIVASIGPLLLAVGKTVSTMGAALKGISALGQGILGLASKAAGLPGILSGAGAAIGGISAPVLAVVAVVAALAAAFKHLWDTNEGFRDAIGGIWDTIASTVSGFCQGIVDRLNALGFDFQDITQVISAAWDAFCNLLAPVFEGAFQVISSVLQTVTGVLTGILDVFIGLFTGNWDQFLQGLSEVFGSVWNGICGVLGAARDTLIGIANAILGWFGTDWNSVWGGISSFFSGIWSSMVSFVQGAWSTIEGIVGAATSAVSGAFSTLSNTVSGIWNGLLGIARSVWDGIRNAITAPVQAAENAVRNVVDAITGFFSGMHLELPHINLPHFSIQGQLSLAPPSVPHLSIDWYRSGGIMARPTVFGMSGSALMAGGEAGPEAILPLKSFYDRLEGMLDERTGGTARMEGYLARIADNSERGVYLDDGTLVGRIAPAIDSRLGTARFKAARGMV